ncbi:MAG: 16S rRNA (uracil(1498)-N(3))-methyltransferase [Gorillibacterium sp.]|nr:16S rRNA (uracil(1498)-N(3))-methyltransferase [Gorillibacterium sp.]
MQRYFIPPEQFGPHTVQICGEDAHHLSRVMRAEPGNKVICCDGTGRSVLVSLTVIGKTEVQADILEELPLANEPVVDVWVAQSLPKGDKLETVIQKCTEIGAARFIPFLSERTIVQYDAKKEEKRLLRWQKIAKEAAEQAHRSVVPEVDAPISWKELLKLTAAEVDLALLCYEKESGQHLRSVLLREANRIGLEDRRSANPADHETGSEQRKPRIMLIIGPEGGISEKEAEQAEAAGCHATGLGLRILRTETAGMTALACILYEYGEMGG